MKVFGELLRSKGFVWKATAHDVMAGWQQAANVLRIKPENPWMCDTPEQWKGIGVEELVLKDIQKPNGEDWEFKDRRQEIVFTGHGMKSEVLKDLLDQCLLSDEEMALGPLMWRDSMEDLNNIKFFLDGEDKEEVEHEEEHTEEDLKENECIEDCEMEKKGIECPVKGTKRKIENDSRMNNEKISRY